MGPRAENPSRAASAWHQTFQRDKQFLRAQPAGRGSQTKSWDSKVTMRLLLNFSSTPDILLSHIVSLGVGCGSCARWKDTLNQLLGLRVWILMRLSKHTLYEKMIQWTSAFFLYLDKFIFLEVYSFGLWTSSLDTGYHVTRFFFYHTWSLFFRFVFFQFKFIYLHLCSAFI